MGKFKTTVMINEATYWIQKILIQRMDIPRTRFHNRAIDYFFENEEPVYPELLITDKTDPKYVKKTRMEQVYLDSVRKAKLEAIAEKNGCGYTIVLFHALIIYCGVMAPVVLGEETLRRLFPDTGSEK